MNMDNLMFIFLIVEAVGLAVAVLIFWRLRRKKQPKARARRVNIGGFSLEKEIGEGGMARIHLARHNRYQHPLAVKILKEKTDKENVQKFLMEGKNIKTINKKFPKSPVVRVHEYGLEKTTGQYFIVMDYLPGLNLKQILDSRQAIPYALKLHIVKEVAKALQASHSLLIYHRDVSPENIIVQGKRVTLIDFGIAKGMPSDVHTAPGVVQGKLNYISPEQFKGQQATDRSDIYALGAVSFYMLEGRPPYVSTNPYDIIMKHQHQHVPGISAAVPEELKRYIYRMLAKEPYHRPHAVEVVENMRSFLRLGITNEYASRAGYQVSGEW